MLRFLLLSALVALASAKNQTQPGYKNFLKARVVGGQTARPHSWPWQVSLQSQSGGKYYHKCGGTLVRKGWVMTAAHCLESPLTQRVGLGVHNLDVREGTEQYRAIRKVHIHPNFNRHMLSNGYDIALLQLGSDAILNVNVQLGALPPFDQILPNNNPCIVTGWGRIKTGGQLSPVLKQAYLPIVDYGICSRSDWWGSIVRTNMVCAGRDLNSGCEGDSGGPLNCLVNGTHYIHGVTSFTSFDGCSITKKPTVFSRVSAYIDWMERIMG